MEQIQTELQEVERFKIFYDADDEELSIHKMDAFYLGQAIQQVAVMVKQAGKVLHEGQELIDLKVTVPAQQGSFAVEFALYAMDHLPQILPVLGFTGGGALAVANRLKNNKVVNLYTEDGTDTAIITYEEHGQPMQIVCAKDEAVLATDAVIRKAYNEIITQPLADKNSPIFRVEVDGRETLRLTDDDAKQFAPLPRKSMTFENTDRLNTTVALTQVNFTSSKGWRMSYHDGDRAVVMEDTAFMDRVLTNQQNFVKGDLFNVRLRIKSIEKPNGSVTTKYAIEQVYHHLADEARRLI